MDFGKVVTGVVGCNWHKNSTGEVGNDLYYNSSSEGGLTADKFTAKNKI